MTTTEEHLDSMRLCQLNRLNSANVLIQPGRTMFECRVMELECCFCANLWNLRNLWMT